MAAARHAPAVRATGRPRQGYSGWPIETDAMSPRTMLYPFRRHVGLSMAFAGSALLLKLGTIGAIARDFGPGAMPGGLH
jgi:hypothetical protein